MIRALLAAAVWTLLPSAVLAAPEPDLWPRWQAHDPQSTLQVDHSDWADFLKRYAAEGPDGIVRVGYDCVAPEGRETLQSYLIELQSTPVSRLNRDQQFAFWVNLYNALTMQVVLDHYPVDSIRDIDISPGLFADGPWRRKLVVVEGEELSLDDIEHRILRPIWQDPRIHYAVNCAAIGCPDLRGPFTAENKEELLDRGARDYVNDPRGLRQEGDRVIASKIYDWFDEDFPDLPAHLSRYADPQTQDLIAQGIDGYSYDWSLNDNRQCR